MMESKFCKDCKHFMKSTCGYVNVCVRPIISLVLGPSKSFQSAASERYGGECGSNGKFWELADKNK